MKIISDGSQTRVLLDDGTDITDELRVHKIDVQYLPGALAKAVLHCFVDASEVSTNKDSKKPR